MNKEIVDTLVRLKPALEAKRASLEALEPGAVVVHRAWGLGKVRSISADHKVALDFPDKSSHVMDAVFCVEKLEVLPSNSLVVRQLNGPDAFEDKAKKEPVEVIIEILRESPNVTADETTIERVLARMMAPAKARKWWTATKKLIIKDPRISCPTKKSESYALREVPVKAEDEVLKQFFFTKSIKKQIQLGNQLLEMSVTHDDVREQLPDILQALAEGLKGVRVLNRGERLYGVWVRNDLARFLHTDVEILEPTSASIIEEAINENRLTELATLIPTSYQKRFLDLIFRCRKSDWDKIALELLRESSGKFTNECVAFLMDKECSKALEDALNRWLNEQALREPILCWIAKNRNTKRFVPMLEKLIGPKLLAAMFRAIDAEALQNATAKRIQLGDILSEDKDLIPELLADTSEEIARDLAQTLILNQGFEELAKRSLLARFIKRHKGIQNLVQGKSGDNGPVDDLIVSIESYRRRQAEYDELVKVKLPENKLAIATAREHGDLKENSEYKMARQDQDTLLAMQKQLETDLSRARQTDFSDVTADMVGVGSVVTLEMAGSGKQVTYAILGAWDSDPNKNVLSYKTPLGQVLLSRKVGESVTTNIDGNEQAYVIRRLQRWIEINK